MGFCDWAENVNVACQVFHKPVCATFPALYTDASSPASFLGSYTAMRDYVAKYELEGPYDPIPQNNINEKSIIALLKLYLDEASHVNEKCRKLNQVHLGNGMEMPSLRYPYAYVQFYSDTLKFTKRYKLEVHPHRKGELRVMREELQRANVDLNLCKSV